MPRPHWPHPDRTAFTLILAFGLAAPAGAAGTLSVRADHADGVYRTAEPIHWTAEWQGLEPAPAARYVVKRGGATTMAEGSLTFTEGRAKFETKLATPDSVLVEVNWQEAGTARHVSAGALVAPERILPAAPPPANFDAFWRGQTEELKKMPISAQLAEFPSDKPAVRYWHVTLDNVHHSHVQGQLARPASGDELPALLILQWAGVYPLKKEWVTERAAEGWLTLNVSAHDLPIDRPDSFYAEQAAGPLKNYWAIGNDDPDTSYYLRMYLACARAVDYLQSRPDWNGRTLVVMGGSQGGQQALAVAGLRPRIVTAAIAAVPAAADVLAPTVGRDPGFPRWYFQTEGKDAQRVRETSRYFDPANFAPWIRCPVLISAALHDDAAPPASVLAVANSISSRKEIILLPDAGHQDENGSHGAFNRRCYGDWLPALRQGKPAPVVSRLRSTVRPDRPMQFATVE